MRNQCNYPAHSRGLVVVPDTLSLSVIFTDTVALLTI